MTAWQTVTKAVARSGRWHVTGRYAGTRSRVWMLTLACEHETVRPVRRLAGGLYAPAPRRVRCGRCP